jgi:DNA repair exonuclease SbcCD ATPase subunit
MIADIRFACTRCGQYMRADAAAAGLAADCPHCGRALVVPPNDGDRAVNATPPTVADDRSEIDRLRQQLAVSVSECERLTAAVTHAQAESKSFQADRVAMKTELAQTRQRLAAAESLIVEQQQWIDGAQTHAAEMMVQYENLQIDLGVAQARTNAITAELAARQLELDALRHQLIEREAARASALAEVTTLQEEHAILRADLETLRTNVAAQHHLQQRLAQTESELLKTMEQVAAAENARSALQQRFDALAQDAAALRADLTDTASGRDLVRLRDQVTALEEERQRLRFANVELAGDFERIKSESTAASDLVRTLRQRLGDAEKRADALSDERHKQDKIALRGLITRQNGELERRHLELHRLKRARLVLRILYALVVLGIVLLALAAVQILPTLDW